MAYRPHVTLQQVSSILLQHYKLHVQHVTELPAYDSRNFAITAVPVDVDGDTKKDKSAHHSSELIGLETFREENRERKYVLKVLSDALCAADRLPTTEKQIECSQYLLQRGFLCPVVIPTHLGTTLAPVGQDRFAELMTFLPGKQLGADRSVITARVLFEVGLLLALMHQALQECASEHLKVDPTSPWALENMHQLSSYLHCIKDTVKRKRLADIIARFTEIRSGKEFSCLTKGVIHGDFHDYNIIVDWVNEKTGSEPSPWTTSSAESSLSSPPAYADILKKYAIIDFEEMAYSYPALELSRLIADMMIDCETVNLLEVGGHVVAGYMMVDMAPVKPLVRAVTSNVNSTGGIVLKKVTQFSFLYETVQTCLTQYIVLKTHENAVQEGTNDYVLLGVAPSEAVLERLRDISAADVYKTWADVLRTYDLPNPFSSYHDRL